MIMFAASCCCSLLPKISISRSVQGKNVAMLPAVMQQYKYSEISQDIDIVEY